MQEIAFSAIQVLQQMANCYVKDRANHQLAFVHVSERRHSLPYTTQVLNWNKIQICVPLKAPDITESLCKNYLKCSLTDLSQTICD